MNEKDFTPQREAGFTRANGEKIMGHPNGKEGYNREIIELATSEWQGVRDLVPDLPVCSETNSEFIEELKKLDPDIEARTSDDKWVEVRKSTTI